ncbi:MAG: CapA family protein [Lachnospiraceae bacterium]|nr:CapA family protein [Lachnospiraceae bacterium]
MKKKHSIAFLMILSCICMFSACSFSDAVDGFGRLLGLDMGPEQTNEVNVSADVEYVSSPMDEPVITKDPVDEPAPEIRDTDITEPDGPLPEYEEIYDEEGKVYSKKAADPNRITISFAGDICLTEGCSVLNYIKRHDHNMKNSFNDELYDLMTGSDIFVLNNEFPYSKGGAPLPDKMYTFRADPADAVLLHDIGVDVVSLANNHCYDYGPVALTDTFATLNDIDMPYIGAGSDINEAMKPAYFLINGKKIAIIAATQIEGYANPETKEATASSPGVLRCLDTTVIRQVIEDAESQSDFVICFIHWGTERSDLIREWQKSTARDMVDSGADFIIGAHSHCLQGIDYIDGVPVCYSLGNYLFNSNTQDTCLITLTLDTTAADATDIESLRFIPCIQSGGMTYTADAANTERIIRYEQGISFHALIDANGYVSYTSKDMNTQNGRNTSPMRKDEDTAEENVKD